MGFATKVAHRLRDPVFYRKSVSRLLRPFRQFKNTPLLIRQDSLTAIKNALVVVAHPDDETFCSGLISALKSNGSEVTLICVTRGEGGPTGGAKREELGSIRENEMMSACEELKVDRVIFLDHVDPLGGAYRVYAPDVSVGQLAGEIDEYREDIDLIVSHGSNGEYWHAAHLLVHAAIRELTCVASVKELVWLTFLARDSDHVLPHLINDDDEAHLRFDATPFHAKRLAALNSHQSQMSLFQRFAGGTTDDFVESTSVESYCVQAGSVEMFTGLGSD